MNKHEQIILQAKIAELYFLEGKDQATIAEMMQFSRSKVSRLLAKAMREGVVEVRIRNPMEKVKRLEEELKLRYSLLHVVVVAGSYSDMDLLRKALGISTAELIDHIVETGDVIGICSGRTVYEIVVSMANLDKQLGVEVIPLLGGTGRVGVEYQINELCRKFAQPLGGTSKLLDAPLVVRSNDTHKLLLEERGIQQIEKDWSRLSKVFLVVGSPAQSSPLTANYSALDQKERDSLMENAVGDLVGRFFDKDGYECRTSVNQRIIGIPFCKLLEVPVRVGIGGGKGRAIGIKAALSQGLVNALVIDEETANVVLSE